MKTYETLKLEHVSDHVMVVTLDRPEARNAMNTQMGLDLRDLWQDIYIEQGDLRCIVVTGTGDKAFCAGGDLKERNGMTDAQWQRQHAIFEQAMLALLEVPVPVIAAVNGAAFGGGTEIALCCDFIYAAERARFALTEITLGIIPGAMGTQNLPRAVGERRAKEIILTGLPFSAEDGLQWGMINTVCANEALLDDTLATATRIAENAPLSTRRAKRVVSIAREVDLHSGYALELEAYNRLVPTEDRLEGVRAFNEKRKPEFKAR